MAYALIVAGGTLYRVASTGSATALALPTGVSCSATRVPRFAVLGRNVLLTNNPSRSLIIDPTFAVRPMQLAAPISPVILSAGAIGGLVGAYQVKYTHKVLDPTTGAVLAESDYSPVSAAVSLASDLLHVDGIAASPDAAVTHHGLYRTLANGEVFFPWVDVEVSRAAFEDGLSDEAITNLEAPRELGAGPGLLAGTYLTQMTVWKNRVWGVGDRDVDTLRYSADGNAYGWPATYGLDIAPVGGDQYGITGLLARRDTLGVGKRSSFTRISGGLPDSDGVPQFDVDTLSEGPGQYGPGLVVKDTAYYLGADGVYAWGIDGFRCVSDGVANGGRVRRWFATDEYFDRTRDADAFAVYNERYDTIEFHLAAAGSATIDRWVSYDRASDVWFGPHQTAKTTPTAAFTLHDDAGHVLTAMGGADGVVYLQNQPTFSDAGVSIALDLRSKRHDAGAPMLTKTFGAVSLVNHAGAQVGSCQVGYAVGGLGAPVSQIVEADLRLDRQTLPRVGVGEFLQVQITEDTNGGACQLYGYEIPWTIRGNRSRR